MPPVDFAQDAVDFNDAQSISEDAAKSIIDDVYTRSAENLAVFHMRSEQSPRCGLPNLDIYFPPESSTNSIDCNPVNPPIENDLVTIDPIEMIGVILPPTDTENDNIFPLPPVDPEIANLESSGKHLEDAASKVDFAVNLTYSRPVNACELAKNIQEAKKDIEKSINQLYQAVRDDLGKNPDELRDWEIRRMVKEREIDGKSFSPELDDMLDALAAAQHARNGLNRAETDAERLKNYCPDTQRYEDALRSLRKDLGWSENNLLKAGSENSKAIESNMKVYPFFEQGHVLKRIEHIPRESIMPNDNRGTQYLAI